MFWSITTSLKLYVPESSSIVSLHCLIVLLFYSFITNIIYVGIPSEGFVG